MDEYFVLNEEEKTHRVTRQEDWEFWAYVESMENQRNMMFPLMYGENFLRAEGVRV